jgi:cytochrome d ubiquinol oxidase subunit I
MRKHEEFAQRSFTGGLIFATIASLMALVTGHSNAEMVARYQPAKLAAFEGHFRTGPAPLHIIGFPDVENREVRGAIGIPGMLSYLVKGDTKADVIGLDKIPRQFWPPVSIPFFSYHLMVVLGFYFIGITLAAWILLRTGRLFTSRSFMWLFVVSVLGPFMANQAGWVSAEVGRQPWVVHPNIVRNASDEPLLDAAGMVQYNLREGLLTHSGVSNSVGAPEILASIIMFSLIYLLLFSIWLYVLNDKIQKGPTPVVIRPARPGGWLASTAGRTLHTDSMSEAKDLPEEAR